MTRTVLHRLPTQAEAEAFVIGATWVNDSDIEFVDYPEPGVARFTDESGDTDTDIDWRPDIEEIERT